MPLSTQTTPVPQIDWRLIIEASKWIAEYGREAYDKLPESMKVSINHVLYVKAN